MADENIIVNEDGTRTDEQGVNIAGAETLSETDRKCPNCGGTGDRSHAHEITTTDLTF